MKPFVFRREWSRFKTGVYGTLAISATIGPALLIAYLVGSLLFVGGQVTASKYTMWESVFEFPLFVVPAWLLTVTSAIVLLSLVVFLLLSSYLDSDSLIGTAGPAGANVGTVFMFGGVYVQRALNDHSLIGDSAYILGYRTNRVDGVGRVYPRPAQPVRSQSPSAASRPVS